MAGISVGHGSSKRALNHEVPLVPYIDFLLCLISFLLVTAVWSAQSRLEATAKSPGEAGVVRDEKPTIFHVDARSRSKLTLSWRKGDTVISQIDLEKRTKEREGQLAYVDLDQRVAEQWKEFGMHRGKGDAEQDLAVLHTPGDMSFGEMTALIDAIRDPKREDEQTAFRVSLATD
ncbi:MAG: biopolymer transporter ExbD [Polyangiaceae bacterium]|nr:biopolymer transporter ExbD [Myxococcales bacterium]MCB9589128.1 biopolymer transporter ExbD [Polyangiaceae bacterium]